MTALCIFQLYSAPFISMGNPTRTHRSVSTAALHSTKCMAWKERQRIRIPVVDLDDNPFCVERRVNEERYMMQLNRVSQADKMYIYVTLTDEADRHSGDAVWNGVNAIVSPWIREICGGCFLDRPQLPCNHAAISYGCRTCATTPSRSKHDTQCPV